MLALRLAGSLPQRGRSSPLAQLPAMEPRTKLQARVPRLHRRGALQLSRGSWRLCWRKRRSKTPMTLRSPHQAPRDIFQCAWTMKSSLFLRTSRVSTSSSCPIRFSQRRRPQPKAPLRPEPIPKPMRSLKTLKRHSEGCRSVTRLPVQELQRSASDLRVQSRSYDAVRVAVQRQRRSYCATRPHAAIRIRWAGQEKRRSKHLAEVVARTMLPRIWLLAQTLAQMLAWLRRGVPVGLAATQVVTATRLLALEILLLASFPAKAA